MKSNFLKFRFITFPALVVIFFVSAWSYLTRPTTLPFHHLSFIHFTHHMDPDQTVQIVWEHLQGGFFSLNLGDLSSVLLKNHWVQSVSFRRLWPDTLMIAIKEKEPKALWGNLGVISENGELFYPRKNTLPKGLPKLQGLKSQEPNIFYEFNKIQKIAKALPIRISVIQVSPSSTYQIHFDNHLVVVLGHLHIEDRFQRFVNLYPKLTSLNNEKTMKHVDVGYTNGLAVQWK